LSKHHTPFDFFFFFFDKNIFLMVSMGTGSEQKKIKIEGKLPPCCGTAGTTSMQRPCAGHGAPKQAGATRPQGATASVHVPAISGRTCNRSCSHVLSFFFFWLFCSCAALAFSP
jgi:hypothetical protein